MNREEQVVLEKRFKENLGRFLVAVQTERVVSQVAFADINNDAVQIARVLKLYPDISKSLLNAWRTGIKVLRAEAPYVPEEAQAMTEMADKLEMTFDLVLMGESPEDRVPGVPRIF